MDGEQQGPTDGRTAAAEAREQPERREEQQRDQAEAGPAQALVGDEDVGEGVRDEAPQPGEGGPLVEGEADPAGAEEQGEHRQGRGEAAARPRLAGEEAAEADAAEEGAADRRRQPELHRVAQRPLAAEDPGDERVEAAERDEDAEDRAPPGPGVDQAARPAGGGEERQGEEPGVERQVVGGRVGVEAVPPEARASHQVGAAEGEGDEPFEDLPGIEARHGRDFRRVAPVAAEGEGEDAQELDDLRHGEQRAGRESGCEEEDGPGARACAAPPLCPPGEEQRGAGEEAGERRHQRIAAEEEEPPEHGDRRSHEGAAAAGGEIEAGGDQGRRQGGGGDQVQERQVRQEKAARRVAGGGGPRRRPVEPPAPRQPVEGERREEQVEPEVRVQGPERRGDQVEEVRRVEGDGVGVAGERLAAGAIGVEEREIAGAHGLGLRPLHRQVGVEHVAQVERLGAADERQGDPGEEDEERRGVPEREGSAREALLPGDLYRLRLVRGGREGLLV